VAGELRLRLEEAGMGNNAAMQGTTRPRAGALPVPHRWGLLEKLVFGPATHSSTFSRIRQSSPAFVSVGDQSAKSSGPCSMRCRFVFVL
jgi:hypothetical protein